MRVVIGVGNDERRDDGFGPAVVRLLGRDRRLVGAGVRLLASDGEPGTLIEAFHGVELAVLADAVRADAPVGSWYELAPADLAALPGALSSHGVSLAGILALAEALGRLPQRVVVLAAVGSDFGGGPGLSPRLAAVVKPVAARATALVLGTNASTTVNRPARAYGQALRLSLEASRGRNRHGRPRSYPR
jgi:hydrogenase maturation protease